MRYQTSAQQDMSVYLRDEHNTELVKVPKKMQYQFSMDYCLQEISVNI